LEDFAEILHNFELANRGHTNEEIAYVLKEAVHSFHDKNGHKLSVHKKNESEYYDFV
jgi:hypothetical protein